MDDETITAVRSALHREAHIAEAMRCVRTRRAVGDDTPDDHAAYLTLWAATVLHRSAARGPYVPAEVDDVLADRVWLVRDVAEMRTHLAVEAAFRAPEEEAPTAARR
jgi:hypothetical protein